MPFRPLDMLRKLRYTRDVMQCRAELVREMPGHLTRHRFHYPFRQAARYPTWLVDMGFRLVEALGGWKVPLAYRRLSPAQAASESALGRGRAEALSRIAAARLGWSEARRQEELCHFEQDSAGLANRALPIERNLSGGMSHDPGGPAA